MRAMVLREPRTPLVLEERPDPVPGPGQLLIRIEACAVCRTDLHVVDDELPDVPHPIVPGHEIVGRIISVGCGVNGPGAGVRIGVPWLGQSSRHCPNCLSGQENLCDHPGFTGYPRDGAYASTWWRRPTMSYARYQ